jgi:hypothetical protein
LLSRERTEAPAGRFTGRYRSKSGSVNVGPNSPPYAVTAKKTSAVPSSARSFWNCHVHLPHHRVLLYRPEVVDEEGREEQEHSDHERGQVGPDTGDDPDTAQEDPDPAHQHGRSRDRNLLGRGVALQLLIAGEVSGEPAHHEQEPEQDPADQEQCVP